MFTLKPKHTKERSAGSAARAARIAVAIACVALVVGVAAQVRLVFQGNTQQQLRVCCENYSAVINAVGSHLTGEWEPFGAPQRINGGCPAGDGSGENNAFVITADPDATAQDWWDVTQIVCRASAVVYRADETQPPRGTVELYPRAPVHDRDTKPVRSAPARDVSAPPRRSGVNSARAFAVPHAFDPVIAAAMAAGTANGDFLTTLFATAFQTLRATSADLGGPQNSDHVRSFDFQSYAVQSVSAQPAGRTVQLRVAAGGKIHRETESTQTFCHGGMAASCSTFHSWDCCNTKDWSQTLGVTVSYTCDGAGAHSFGAAQVDGVGFAAADAVMRRQINAALATIAVPKAQDAPLCPPQ